MDEFDSLGMDVVRELSDSIVTTLNSGDQLSVEESNALCVRSVFDRVLARLMLDEGTNWDNTFKSFNSMVCSEDVMISARIPFGVLYGISVWARAGRDMGEHFYAFSIFGVMSDMIDIAKEFFDIIGSGRTFDSAEEYVRDNYSHVLL